MRDTQIFQSKCAAVTSSSESYEFLSVSDDLGALFDFAPEQMFGRSIKMLQGPGTNVAQLGAAIKSARLRHHSKIPKLANSFPSPTTWELSSSQSYILPGALQYCGASERASRIPYAEVREKFALQLFWSRQARLVTVMQR